MITLNLILPPTFIIDIGPNLQKLGAQIVATLADFTAKLDAIDGKVTGIAAEIADLKAQLATGGLTAAEEQTLSDRLDTLSAALDAAK